MCIACELGFWMAMEEEAPKKPNAALKRKRAAKTLACDAPLEKAKPAPRRKAAKPRRTARAVKASAARD